MNWRYVRRNDARLFRELRPERFGDAIVGLASALEAWEWLIGQRAFGGCIVEDPATRKVTGCGGAAFVTEEFARVELEQPRPGLNARFIETICAGRPVTLDARAIARENARANFHVLVLYTHWAVGLNANEIGEVQVLNPQSFMIQYAGYRLTTVFSEAIHQEDLTQAEMSIGWRVASRFEEYFAANPASPLSRDRGLGVCDREMALRNPGAVASRLFLFPPPVLGLSDNEQQMLLLVLRGMPDQEIASQLGRSLSAVKWWWGSVFAKVEARLPDLLPSVNATRGRETRGPEKRSLVLTYLKNHPEELRPYEVARRAGR